MCILLPSFWWRWYRRLPYLDAMYGRRTKSGMKFLSFIKRHFLRFGEVSLQPQKMTHGVKVRRQSATNRHEVLVAGFTSHMVSGKPSRWTASCSFGALLRPFIADKRSALFVRVKRSELRVEQTQLQTTYKLLRAQSKSILTTHC